MCTTRVMPAGERPAVTTVVSLLGRASPRSTAPEGLRDASPYFRGDPVDLAAAADGVGIVVGCLLGAAAVVIGAPALLLVAVGGGYGTTLLARGGVRTVAAARRSRSLGSAPTLVSRAVLRARLEPTAEAAASFAAETDGPLGERLAAHVRRAEGTPRSGLGTFAATWREPFPAFHRALSLVDAAAAAPDGERHRTLDHAMDAILEGTRERAADAADALAGPVTAVYAFGVLLPLALVGVLPAAAAAGVHATLPAVVLLYDVVLPIGLCGAGMWLLANRPVAFPPARVDRELVGDTRGPALLAGATGATAAFAVAMAFLPVWCWPLAAVGVGTGVALLVWCRPVVEVRNRTAELEGVLPDALYLVGRRVSAGVAVERAVAEAARELDGVGREVFEAAARRQRQLGVDVETAFVGEYGALEAVPSRRAESAARLLGVAAAAGAPAGRALAETADHLDSLRRVERDARRDLGRVTATLGNTAAFFGPLVGGATVALADGIGTADALDGSPPATAGLGLAVGVYVLLMAVVLTALATGLDRGFDRATVGYRVGGALCAATASYLLAFHASGLLTGGL